MFFFLGRSREYSSLYKTRIKMAFLDETTCFLADLLDLILQEQTRVSGDIFDKYSTQIIPGDFVEQPYKELLVHSSNMTPRLEGFYRQQVHLSVLSKSKRDGLLTRLIYLCVDDGRVVELAYIRIYLSAFDAELANGRISFPELRRFLSMSAAELCLGLLPFATLLLSRGIQQRCEPQAFFTTTHNSVTALLNSLPGQSDVENHHGTPRLFYYGRCNVISECQSGQRLAEVLEIMPFITSSLSSVS